MKVLDLINNKQQSAHGNKPVTVAFLGDSTTHGCFECYEKSEGVVEAKYEYVNSYSNRFREQMNTLYPSAQINVINSGISGDCAKGGLERIERDILAFNPDLTIVSFGLNDCCMNPTEEGAKEYGETLEQIFAKLKQSGSEIIFMSENIMCDYLHYSVTNELLKKIATNTAKIQNDGMLDKYFDTAKKVCSKNGIIYLDMYSKWKKMKEKGVDTTALLSNGINHPIREYYYYVASKLIETIFEN